MKVKRLWSLKIYENIFSWKSIKKCFKKFLIEHHTAEAIFTKLSFFFQNHIICIHCQNFVNDIFIISSHQDALYCHFFLDFFLNFLDKRCRRFRLRTRFQNHFRRFLFSQLRSHSKKYQRSIQFDVAIFFQ